MLRYLSVAGATSLFVILNDFFVMLSVVEASMWFMDPSLRSG